MARIPNPRGERVTIRITPLQAAVWRVLADQAGLALSEWLRRLADRRVAEETRGMVAEETGR